MAERVRLSRAKGFRLAEDVINVARPGKLGNPFVVGRDGTRAECVHLFALMCGGFLVLTCIPTLDEQRAYMEHLKVVLPRLKGRDMACWCALDGKPCHADVLLKLANAPLRKGLLDEFLIREIVA
jgi:hypothetical protein